MKLVTLLLRNPISTIRFLHSFIIQSLLIFTKRILLPGFPTYQSLRIQLHRAYLSSCSVYFPDLVHRLPVDSCPEHRAKKIGSGWTGYFIPGTKVAGSLEEHFSSENTCVAVYAHGGGYARGEARMYLNYMERWVKVAAQQGLDLTFLSVEYLLTDKASHPSQLKDFLKAYQYLMDKGVPARKIFFMGDSAGGGLCVLSSIESMHRGLPQPAGSILMSPWMDMSMRCNKGGNALVETDYVVTANTVVPIYADRWLDGRSASSPEVNPLCRNPEELMGLNPQLIFTGAGEFAMQESKDFAVLCERADIKHELVVEQAQLHIYALGSNWIESRVREETDARIIRWITHCLTLKR